VLAHAAALRIEHVVVHGNSRLSVGEVQAVLSELRGDSIVRVDLERWRTTLMSSPWIEEAALRRSLPSTLDVFITERVPIALGRMKGDLYLIDEHGAVIDQYGPRYADVDLPVVDGIVDQERAELAARLISSLQGNPEVAGRVSQVDVTDARNAAVVLDGDSAVIYVGTDRFLPRLASYLQLAPALREQVPAIDSVDLRFDDRIYVRPVRSTRSRGMAVRRP
jgi:cell division protein FtsQ